MFQCGNRYRLETAFSLENMSLLTAESYCLQSCKQQQQLKENDLRRSIVAREERREKWKEGRKGKKNGEKRKRGKKIMESQQGRKG